MWWVVDEIHSYVTNTSPQRHEYDEEFMAILWLPSWTIIPSRDVQLGILIRIAMYVGNTKHLDCACGDSTGSSILTMENFSYRNILEA